MKHLFFNARFTVSSSECIRLEYSSKKHFVNEPSLFAINRSCFFKDYRIEKAKEKLGVYNINIVIEDLIQLTHTRK